MARSNKEQVFALCIENRDCEDLEKRKIYHAFTLPDLRKPYLISIKSGLGKTGADITINNGWQLGNVKDQSDNTAFMTEVIKSAMNIKMTTSQSIDCSPGLFYIDTISDNNQLKLILKKLDFE